MTASDDTNDESCSEGCGCATVGDHSNNVDPDKQRIPTEDKRTVSLSTTVDVTDVGAEQIRLFEQFASLYEELFETFVEKNLGYGSSFRHIGTHLAERDGGPFDDPTRAALYAQFTQTGHKRERFHSLVFGDGQDQVKEDPEDTCLDAANYWLFSAYLIRNHPFMGTDNSKASVGRTLDSNGNTSLTDSADLLRDETVSSDIDFGSVD